MEFERIPYLSATGIYSKATETYNFHKAAGVLAEYGFDCVRVVNDWRGADFIAYHATKRVALPVQLKTCLVISERLCEHPELYFCFTLDKTGGSWYLIQYERLYGIVRNNAPQWFKTKAWTNNRGFFKYTAPDGVRNALKEYEYTSRWGDLGFRECVNLTRAQIANTNDKGK